ncbi:MAG TPA: tRNA lysidine(34) synthetase TilS [Isosphaeraceae bacterium]|nr:tRNA lysidine(34) synthetase TilS [Isosphaeraceae bacterium]
MGGTGLGAWRDRVARRVGRWRGSGLGPSWVVAVSGGGDSVALLRLLHDLAPGLGLALSVAHLDHGTRGAEGEADARFVAELAGELGLPCDLGRWAPVRAGHFEADARRARYGWLAAVARDRGASAVAVGHTRDDQAETVLHRVLRGTGPRGLAGMPARRPLDAATWLVRPLLDVPRATLRAELARLGQGFRDDPTNLDQSRTRARIRHDLLPRLADDYNPRVVAALARLARLAGRADRGWRSVLDSLSRTAVVSAGAGSIVFDRDALRALPSHVRAELIRHAWRARDWPEAGMGLDRWLRLARLGRRPSGRYAVGGGIVAECSEHELRLSMAGGTGDRHLEDSEPVPVPPDPVPLPIPGAADWPGGRVVATLDPADPADETVDLDRLAPPLLVTPPSPGDRLDPLGLGGHHQGLADLLRSRRVPRDARRLVPVVRDADGIVWVVGHRLAHRARVTDATRRTLGLRWEAEGVAAEDRSPSS